MQKSQSQTISNGPLTSDAENRCTIFDFHKNDKENKDSNNSKGKHFKNNSISYDNEETKEKQTVDESFNNKSTIDYNNQLHELLKSSFDLIDSDNKGFIDIKDIQKLNDILQMGFTDDDLEGLLELAGKSDSKISFDNFIAFISEN